MRTMMETPTGEAATPSGEQVGIMTPYQSSPISSSPSTAMADDTLSQNQSKRDMAGIDGRPTPKVAVNLARFPEKLKAELPFAAWSYERDDQGRWTKVSRNPRTGGKSMPNNPSTFASLSTAIDFYRRCRLDGVVAGIFKDFGCYACLDVDHCVDDSTGKISDYAQLVLGMLPGAYWELSPSGKGIHVWLWVPSLVAKYDYDEYRAKYYINHGGLEAYTSRMTNHVITVTGEGSGEFGTDRSAQYEALLDRLMLRPKRITYAVQTPTVPLDISDQQLVAMAMHAKNGTKFCTLWNGDTSAYRTISANGIVNDGHSEADLALCTILAFWTQRDRDRIDALFRKSGLYRPKWEREDYRTWTVDKAVSGCSDVYCGSTPNKIDYTNDCEARCE